MWINECVNDTQYILVMVDEKSNENNKGLSSEKDSSCVNPKVVYCHVLVWGCDHCFSLITWSWWARSRTGTGWSTPRGWCWWTCTASGAGPAPPWRLTSRSSGWPPSWPRTGSASPGPAATTLGSSRPLEKIPDQLGAADKYFFSDKS